MEAGKLPKDSDGRLVGHFGKVTHPVMSVERLYCFMCGSPAGWVSFDSSQFVRPAHVSASCNKCDAQIIEKYGKWDFPLTEIPHYLLDAFGIIPEPAMQKLLPEKTL